MITPSGLNYQAPSCGVCVIMHRKGRVVQSAHVLVNKTIHTIEKDICLCVQLHMCMCVCECVCMCVCECVCMCVTYQGWYLPSSPTGSCCHMV